MCLGRCCTYGRRCCVSNQTRATRHKPAVSHVQTLIGLFHRTDSRQRLIKPAIKSATTTMKPCQPTI